MIARANDERDVEQQEGAEEAEREQDPTFEFTPIQLKFWEAITCGRYKYLAMGGAIRGSKTFGSIGAMIALCTLFPRSRGVIVRKDLPTLRRNTIPSFEKIRDTTGGFVGPLNKSEWTYDFKNGSKILLFSESLEDDPDLNRWKGFEANFILLEEANEMSKKAHHKSIERAGSWIIPPTQEERRAMARAKARGENPKLYGPDQPPPLILYTFNPADNWIRDVFYDPFAEGTLAEPYFYLPATIFDNPYVDQPYLDSLKELPEQDYKRFVLGDWGLIVQPNQVIETKWIIDAYEVPFVDGPTREGLDIARFGDDQTVFAHSRGNALTEIVKRKGWSTETTADHAALRMIEYNIDPSNYKVDAVGLGGGPVDKLVARGFRVCEFIAGAKPVMRKRVVTPSGDETFQRVQRFADRRSQAWWEYRERLRTGQRRITVRDKELVADLTAPRYTISSDRTLRVESKDETKKRIGRSPDVGDAVVMGDYDMPQRAKVELQRTTTQRVWR